MGENIDRAIEWMQAAVDRTPWAGTGLLLATAAAILLAYPLGKALRSNPVIVGFLLASFFFAWVFTLTPHVGEVYSAGQCYMKFSQPSRADLVQPTDFSLNILLFLPTGILIMFLRPAAAVFGVAVFALIVPPAIEYIQLTQTQLGRTCSFLDIATNELGLVVGLVIGGVARLIWEMMRATTNRVRR